MPLVRVHVRNEYSLGQPELYREANREDPKAVLDGVAVAGLVGILRQLGDLAEFSAEVFHGLQEQVMNTSSRSHKLMVRVQRIEAALPPLEKAILAQKSHLHFAYTAGSVWHAHLQNEQNQFIYSDLPQFIMDSYEECRDPPRLHLLDKFDTGGPGSCLKRYSDPNFFRRASASSGEVNVEKVSKERKAQRNKKKRSQRNEVSRGASISNHSDRTQFAFPKVDGQISPSETDSTFDLTFDSRTGPGYIECVYPPTYSMKQEVRETKQSSISSLTMHHNDIIGSASVDEHSGGVDDDFPHNSLQEQTFPSSSCVTWDEKTEIVEPMDNQYDRDETVENLIKKFDRDIPENGTVNSRIVNQMDFQFDKVDAPPSISGENHLDGIESETDNYMDALNTIESETETDLDCQTKREVELSSNASNEGTQYEMHGLTAHHSYLQPSNLETDNAAHNSASVVTSCDIPNSISPCYANEESLKMGGESSDIGNSLGMDFCRSNDNLDGSNLESGVVNLPCSGSTELNSKAPIIAESHPNAPMSDDIVSTSCESEKSPIEPTGVQSVKFWTNGGLLGLEPSKPPDFSVLNASSQDSVTVSKDDIVSPSSQSNILNGDGDAGNQNKLVQSSKSIGQISSKLSTSCQNDEEGVSDKKTPWRFFPAEVDAGCKKCGDSDPNNRFNDYPPRNLTETSASVPETEQVATPDVKAVSIEASQRDVENSCQVSGLSNRFLVNGFQRKLSLVHDENMEVPSTRKTESFEQKNGNQSVLNQAFSERNLKGCYGSESMTHSPSSSPPLQHMKISFQPISGFETSKLKLKFPDGSFHHCSSREMLPSFQLVPEPATSQLDVGSDSDDDTFCRSSLYKSDDCLSPHSDTNSEQWESDDTAPTKDNELNDAFRRIRLTESVSSSMELEKMGHGNYHVDCGLKSQYLEACLDPFQSGQLLELPSLSTLNPLFEQELKNGSDANGMSESHLPTEPTPLPPPLPPLEWRAMRSHSDESPLMIDEQDSLCKALNHAFDLKILESTISTQSNPSLVKLQQITDEAIAFTPKNKPEWQELNGLKEDNQATNGRGIDEKEDFLHQIRTKSFNLRRTVTEKPTVTSGPTTNVKVTAILEKANAIRQAVGSDEGEENDSWSDT